MTPKQKKGWKEIESKRQCRFCTKEFNTKKEVKSHVYSHFISQILDDNPCLREPPFDCPKCSSKKWRDRSALLRHFALTHQEIYKYCNIKDLYGSPLTKHKKVNDKVNGNVQYAKKSLRNSRISR